jgi:hypothetical protein
MSLRGDVLYKKDFNFDGHTIHEIGTEISDEKPLAFTFNFDVTQNFSAIGIDAGVNVNGKERLAVGAEETEYKAIRGSGVGANTDMKQVKMAGLTNPQNDDPDKPFAKVTKTATGFVVTYSYTKVEGNGNDKTTITEELTAYIGQYREEPDVVIKPLSSNEVAYERWIPKGEVPTTNNGSQITENKGNKISFGVNLVNKNTKDKIVDNDAVVIYELPESEITKNEGSCINYPFSGADNEPDLEFDESFYKNNALVESYSKTKIVSKLKNGLLLSAVVKSKDFAAYGKLKATVLYKGNSYQAHNDKNLTVITIPLDENNNKIADAWEKDKDNNIFTYNYSMDWDKEHVNNNNYDGDGLTLYEEYRGIIAKGKHIRLSPVKKDLIIANDVGDKLKPGFNLLESAENIQISEIKKEELDAAKHIINSNNSISKQGDQHAILCVKYKFPKDSAAVFGQVIPKIYSNNEPIFGSPKDCIEYRINQDRLGQTVLVLINVPHEIGHYCGLHHHGRTSDKDMDMVRTNLNLFSSLKKITVLNMNGDTVYHIIASQLPNNVPYFKSGVEMYNKKSPSEASGDVRCFMTYNNKYEFEYDPLFYTFRMTPLGEQLFLSHNINLSTTHFCTSVTGTEWNSGGKFGCDGETGNCFANFKIKDY